MTARADSERDILVTLVRSKLAGAKEQIDDFIQSGAAEDDEYAVDPLYLDWLREKREADELDRRIYREEMRAAIAVSRRNRGEK